MAGVILHARSGPDAVPEDGPNPEAGGASATLSVVIPTKNEAGNVREVVERLERAVGAAGLEIVFVDDSSDETPAAVEEVSASARSSVVLLHRRPEERKGGLGGAVVAGMTVAKGDWICVMDGDLQHPPELVPQLLAAAEGGSDLVVGSRYCDGGASGSFGSGRSLLSKLCTSAARTLFPRRLARVSDPMSGFFLFRRGAVAPDALRPNGFKILLEVVARTPGLKISEVPFSFGVRLSGESKASVAEGMTYARQLARLRLASVSGRALRFGTVGASGLVVNLLALALLAEAAGFHYLLAAILATQASTLWNFGLTDRWVYGGRAHRRPLRRRLLLYLGMNNAALVLRGPMLVGLVWLGTHYLLANLVTIAALTVVRFAVSDVSIWKGSQQAARSWSYSIHGLVTVESPVRLPELEPFRIAALDRPATVRVRIGGLGRRQSELVAALGFVPRHVRYDERLGRFGFAMDIGISSTTEIVASPLLRRSPHVLYTNVVEPVLRWTFAERGYALVHAASIAIGDDAYLITAKTDTGKTTTILKTLDEGTCSFISDDLTLVSPEGRVLSYPKPLTISRHTVGAVSRATLTSRQRAALVLQSRLHSREGRQMGLLLTRLGFPTATMNAIVQLLVPPPKYAIEKLVPHAETRAEAQLAGLVVIQRGGEGEVVLGAHEALETLLANCDDAYGFPPYPAIAHHLYLREERDLREAEREIVRSALTGIPATLVRSNTMDWWQRLPRLVARSTAAFGGVEPEAAAVGAAP